MPLKPPISRHEKNTRWAKPRGVLRVKPDIYHDVRLFDYPGVASDATATMGMRNAITNDFACTPFNVKWAYDRYGLHVDYDGAGTYRGIGLGDASARYDLSDPWSFSCMIDQKTVQGTVYLWAKSTSSTDVRIEFNTTDRQLKVWGGSSGTQTIVTFTSQPQTGIFRIACSYDGSVVYGNVNGVTGSATCGAFSFTNNINCILGARHNNASHTDSSFPIDAKFYFWRLLNRFATELELREWVENPYGFLVVPEHHQWWTDALKTRGPGGGVVFNTSDLRWQIFNSVSSDSDLRWQIFNSILNDLELRWSIGGGVASDIDLRWQILNQVLQDSDLRWQVLEEVSQLADLRWQIFSEVGDNLDIRWAIGSGIVSDLDLRWQIINQVASSIDLNWQILESVVQDEALQWQILRVVANEISLHWNIIESVSNDLEIQWGIAGGVGQNITLRWQVQGLTEILPPSGRILVVPEEHRIVVVENEQRVVIAEPDGSETIH